MEDFGYSRGNKEPDNLLVTKKFFLIAASLFSIACFIYITINAYYFIYQDNNANVETVKSPEEPIKITEEEKTVAEGGETEIDRSVYDDIFGNKKESLKNSTPKIRASVEPAIPPKVKELPKEDLNEPAANEAVKNEVKENKTAEVKKSKKPIDINETTPKKVVKKKTATKKRSIKVQLAAMTSAKLAEDYWVKLNESHSRLFSSLDPYIEEVELGKRGTFYRLQVGVFFNQIEAEEFCNKYVAKAHKTRADCIIVE
jgi:hypothetical protein